MMIAASIVVEQSLSASFYIERKYRACVLNCLIHRKEEGEY